MAFDHSNVPHATKDPNSPMKTAKPGVIPSILFALVATGCGSNSKHVVSTTNPQVAAFTITPSSPGNVTVEFGPDTSYGFKTSPQHTPDGGGPVTIQVAGMKADTLYHMHAIFEEDGGKSSTTDDETFTSGDLPSGILPKFTVTPTSGMTPQPGVELVDMASGATPSVPFATDTDGNVVWTYSFPDRQKNSILYPVKLLPNGHFMFLISPLTAPENINEIREIDLVGNTIRQVTMDQLNASLAAGGFNVNLFNFSHDFVPLANGHILVICTIEKTFAELSGYPGSTTVVGDAVVDVDETFKPVWVWNSFDHLDINRRPFQFPDWTHSNALAYSADDGNFLISVRHQNWILKIDYRNGAGTGNILWHLGYQGDFKLEGGVDPTDWFYAQHDVNFVSTNTTGSFKLAIMDNGDDRVFAPGVSCGSTGAQNPPCYYTTIPIMEVNENTKTATFLSHQILPPSLYSYFAGSTRVLANSNVEYNLAGVGADSYTYEVTPTATPQTVWQMHVVGTNTYRSFRIPSLYPGVQW